jgi:hypothetical protein
VVAVGALRASTFFSMRSKRSFRPLISALRSYVAVAGRCVGVLFAMAESVMPVKEKTRASTAIHITEAVGIWLSLFFLEITGADTVAAIAFDFEEVRFGVGIKELIDNETIIPHRYHNVMHKQKMPRRAFF